MSILRGYPCTTCMRPTNHGIVSHEHSLPNYNFSYIQCLSCDSGAFAVQYSKEEFTPTSGSVKVTLPVKENDLEYPASLYLKDQLMLAVLIVLGLGKMSFDQWKENGGLYRLYRWWYKIKRHRHLQPYHNKTRPSIKSKAGFLFPRKSPRFTKGRSETYTL